VPKTINLIHAKADAIMRPYDATSLVIPAKADAIMRPYDATSLVIPAKAGNLTLKQTSP
jgi:hypothetical protein